MESNSSLTAPFASGLELSRRTELAQSIAFIDRLKKGVWLYFWLLLFEGALRRWVLPGLATPLLIVRDPLAIWLVVSYWSYARLASNAYVILTVLITLTATVAGVTMGHGNLVVALFGARILLVHFPLMFVIGCLFDQEDVLKIGRMLCWVALPMVVLIVLQFYGPQSSWVNRGVGGDMKGAGFVGALQYFRPPATFSFTNGTHLFFGMVGAFVVYFWLMPRQINRLLLVGATLAVLVSVPFSISRSLFFHLMVSLGFALFVVVRRPRYLGRMIITAIAGGCLLAGLSTVSVFGPAFDAFSVRFTQANKIEGGVEGVVSDRYLGGLLEPFATMLEIPFWGAGLGMGTNVGSAVLATGPIFLISEGEWGRLIGEMGPVLGLGFILIRLSLCGQFLARAYRYMVNEEPLPWMLLSYGLLVIPQGQWAQPTCLGFSTLVGGLILASFRKARPSAGTGRSSGYSLHGQIYTP